MKKVVLRGPALTQSGYGVHCRQIAKWLLQRPDVDLKIIVTPWGSTPWHINGDSCDGLIGQIMKRTIKSDGVNADISFQLQLPNEWTPNLAREKNIGITAAVETDICSPTWVQACNSMDAIIVPSQHTKQCLTNTGTITKPLYVVPESYSSSITSTNGSSVELPTFSTSFNFLIFGQLTGNNPHNDRKNIFNTIKWICETFKDDPEVGIVIKTNIGTNSKIDRNIVTGILKTLLSEVRQGPGPKIYLIHGDMNDDTVAALYKHKQIKALVALTRGEGFGLPILEAAASGLPIIATGWSGHLDYLKLGKYVNIYYQLEEVHKSRVDGGIFVKGSRWANPSEEDFKKRIAKFKSNNAIPFEWAAELQKKIIETHSFESICKSYDLAVGEIFS
jgi:glycosyltransferase involved in cell wall biosynthesis